MTSIGHHLDALIAWLRLALVAARRAAVRFVRSEDFTYASAIAYYALFSLFPLLLIAVSVVARFTDSEAERAAVTEFLLQFVPQQVDLVSAQLERIGSTGRGLEVAGTAVVVWVSLGVFRVISQAVNHAWDVEERPGYLRHQLVAFIMLLASGVFLLGVLAWVTLVGMVRSEWFGEVLDVLPALDAIAGLSSRTPATLVLIIVVAAVHYFVPATAVRFRDVWPGAVLTGVLWHAAVSGFSWYLAEVADLSFQGSLATVVTFMVWVYVSAVVFLYGVEFTAAWVRVRAKGYS